MVTAEAGNEYVQLAAEPGSEPGFQLAPCSLLPHMTDETAAFPTSPPTPTFSRLKAGSYSLTNESQLMRRKEGKIQNWEGG